VTSSTGGMMSSLQIMIEKKLESDQQRQPNIFVLQAFLKKLHGGEANRPPPPRVK